MQALRDTAQAWLDLGEPVALIEVTGSAGSVPRERGTRMLVSASSTAGTIGGGHLELKAIVSARELLAAGGPPREMSFALGPSLGQCCGGHVDLRIEPMAAHHLAEWPPEPPLFHLQLHGAGHVGRAIARLLSTLPVRVDWYDEREDEFQACAGNDSPWPAHIRRVATEAAECEVHGAPAGAFYLVLTHRHDLDLRIAEAILRRGDFAFFGLIGSRTKRQRFIHRFEAAGLPLPLIERMVCPIGVPGIPGKSPEVVAVGVVAQLLQQAALHSGA